MSGESAVTWRDALAALLRIPQERQHLANALGINPITLHRWATGQTLPRIERLRHLLQILDPEHETLRTLLIQAYPDLASSPLPTPTFEIPSPFYAQVLQTYSASLERLRSSSILLLVLQQMLAHFDPHRQGMVALLLLCVPPSSSSGQSIRSLRAVLGRATTSPWDQMAENMTGFFGAESQAAQALIKGNRLVVNSVEELNLYFPVHRQPEEQSRLLVPLQRADEVAGCLCLMSMQAQTFSEPRQLLAEQYAYLLLLGIEPHQWYPRSYLHFHLFPPFEDQQALIATVQSGIRERTHAQRISWQEAELQAWQQIESDLCELAVTTSFY